MDGYLIFMNILFKKLDIWFIILLLLFKDELW